MTLNNEKRNEVGQQEITGSIPSHFARMVSDHADRIAVKSIQHSLTYRELDQISNRLARELITLLGNTPEPIALLLDHDTSVMEAIMGVIKSGKFYCALNQDDPQPHLKTILGDLETRLMITDSQHLGLANEITPSECKIFNLDLLDKALSSAPVEVTIPSDALFGIFYTSGSTSTPKGVPRQHVTTLHRILISRQIFNRNAEDRSILVASCSTSSASNEIFEALLNGAGLYIYDVKKSGITPLVELLDQEKISILFLPIEMLRYFLDLLPEGKVFSHVRWVELGGDVLFKRDIEKIYRHFPSKTPIDYRLSSTETGILARTIIHSHTVFEDNVVPVGYPVPGKEILLLNENHLKVEPNQAGEIAIRTRFMFGGYWKRPDLTETRFMPDPENPGQQLYLSGDLGRFRPDGQLVYMGRKDYRIKIRGFSVDPPAIENALMQVDGMQRAVVMSRPDPSGEKRLVAYVQLNPKSEITVDTLRGAVLKELPDFMMPSYFVYLDRFPLTNSGKVNRQAFPEPPWDSPNINTPYFPAQNDIQKKLVTLWQEVLSVRQVGIHDDFFDLGGHSLLAVRLCVEIKTTFNRSISPANLVACNTIERLAVYLDQKNDIEKSLLIPLQPHGSKPPLFVAPGRDGDVYYFLTLSGHLGKDQPMYGMQLVETDTSYLPPDLEEMAAYFLNQIRSVQPSGPYYLLGHSFGSHLIFEIAQRLLRAGEKVAFLGMLDTRFPTPQPRLPLRRRVKIHAHNFRTLPPSGWAGYVTTELKFHFVNLARKPAVQAIERKLRLVSDDVAFRNVFASKAYQHKKYPGKITLFQVINPQTKAPHPHIAGWKNMAAEVEFMDVPGEHGTMLYEPNVTGLAIIIQKAMVQNA